MESDEAFKGWKRRANGIIKTTPMTGFETAIFGDMNIALRIDGLRSEHSRLPEVIAQMALTPAAARHVAQALLDAADRCESPKGTSH